MAVVIIGVLILLVSGQSNEKKLEIFKNYPFSLYDEIVKPFRILERGKLTCTFTELMMISSVDIYLTDLSPSDDVDFSSGPRYFQITNQYEQIDPFELGRGEYAFVFDGRGARYSGKYSLEFESIEYPRGKYWIWGLAYIQVGISIILLGLTR